MYTPHTGISAKEIYGSKEYYAVEDFLISYEKLDPKKLVTIYNGICCKREEGWNVRGNRIGPNGICIVIVASLVENKGHRYLFEALSKIVKTRKNIRLRVVGDGPLKFQLSDYSKSLGIDEYTEFLGIRDDVQAILKNSDILVLPSIEREGLGIALVEAMCQGKPVIGTNIGGIPEVIEDGVNGYLVNPRDPDALAEKLEILIKDKQKRERMGREGRKKFQERFDAAIMIKKIERLYESLLCKKGLGVSCVLYLHNTANISGGEQSLMNLWRNMDRRIYVSHLIIPNDGLLSEEARRVDVEIGLCDIPQLRPKNALKILRAFLVLAVYCKKKGIRIIHSYTPRNNILAALLGKIEWIPVVWHERNLIFGDEIDISRRFYFLPDKIICNSQAIAERFRRGGGIPSKVQVILNGVDLKKFSIGNAIPLIQKKYNPDEKKVVGLISNLGKRKMPEYLLEACPQILKKYPNTLFLFVGGEFGDEDKGRKKELEENARNLGVVDRVIFTGFLPNVSDIIQVFDVGVAVTEKEACSRAILEMMACGKPVVAFKTGGNPELIKDGVTGTLVNFGDIKGFATAVSNFLKNDEKRKMMGMQARQRAEKYFDVKINARKTQTIYSRLIGKADI
jgi:glycosyltransferase involved in cell wall biosynthesis